MARIEIIFNRESFNKPYKEEIVSLVRTSKPKEIFKIDSKIEPIILNSRTELISLFEKIRGCETNNLKLKFLEIKYNKWANAGYYEQQAFKSLLLIYHWLELSLVNPDDLDVSKNLFDEFIVDWNYTPDFQNTLYLIEQKHSANKETVDLLNVLVEKNLLCKLKIFVQNKNYLNYFIPLMTPGVSAVQMQSKFDNSGHKTNELWQLLLKEKNLRIKNWVNNRF